MIALLRAMPASLREALRGGVSVGLSRPYAPDLGIVNTEALPLINQHEFSADRLTYILA